MRRIDWYLVLLWSLVLIPAAWIFRDWLFSLRTIAFADWPYLAPQTMADFWPMREGWIAYNGVGFSSAASLPGFLLDVLCGLASLAHIPFEVFERAVYFVPAFIICLAGTYALTLELTHSRTAAIVASAFSIFNGYGLRILGLGQVSIFVAAGLLPVFALLFIKLMRGVTPPRVAGMIAVFGAMLAYDLRIAYVAVLVGLMMGAGYLALQHLRALPSLAGIGGSIVAAVLFVHAAWVLPSLYYHKLEPKLPPGFDARGWFDVLSYFTLPEALTLYHQWKMPGYGTAYPPVLPYIVLFALALMPILLRPRRPWVVGLTGMALLFAMLMKGARPPFSELSTWIFRHVPGMYGFRDPSKFAGVIVFAEAALIGYATVLLGGVFPRFARVFPIAAIALVLAAHGYAFSRQIGGAIRARDVPPEYTELIEYITNDTRFSRVVWMPRRATFHVRTREHPIVEALADLPGPLYYYTNNNEDNTWGLGWIEQPYSGWLMRDLDVGYFVVPDERIDDQAFAAGWTPRAHVATSLDRLPWLAFDRKFGGIDVYRVKDPLPLVTGSSAAILMRDASPADLRHFKNAALPEGALDAPTLTLSSSASPPPDVVDVDLGDSTPGARTSSHLWYGGDALAVLAYGATDIGLVGAERAADGGLTLSAARGFFPSDSMIAQPAAGPSSVVTLSTRVKPSGGVSRFSLTIYCAEDQWTGMGCADGYALEWARDARLVRYRYGKPTVLAVSQLPLRDQQWHDIRLTISHPDIGTQLLSATLDGSTVAHADTGDQIVYRGRVAITTTGGDVELGGAPAIAGEWPAPIFDSLQPTLARESFTVTEPVELSPFPIGAASPIARVPLLDANISVGASASSRTPCGAPAGALIRPPFEAPLFGKPLLEWRKLDGPAPSWIGLVLRDGQGEVSCVVLPIEPQTRTVDVQSYIALENAAGQTDAARARPNASSLMIAYPHPAPADDFILTGIALAVAPAGAHESLHLSLDIERSALKSDVVFENNVRIAAPAGRLVAACAALPASALDFAVPGSRWTARAPMLLMGAREIAGVDLARADELAQTPSYLVGIAPPQRPDEVAQVVTRLSAASPLQAGTCTYRPRDHAQTPEIRIDDRIYDAGRKLTPGAHVIRTSDAPLPPRASGLLLATPTLLHVRSIPVTFAQLEGLHYRAEVPSAPAWIVFRQGYDAGWVARARGGALLHLPADDVFNAYYVDRPGTVDIEYAPRRLAVAGQSISIVSATLLTIYLLSLLWKRRS
ncbi:MAG TPA: hypothetical protein VKF82_12225 [Candidatus Eremiobacteraceae bacterium]|nr:hypothetical protein [Candidatus Eremiobacteraceae bacterium]